MFRDTYKSAMDDIKPDSDLLGTILSRAGKAKKHSLFSTKWIYSVGACAASFLLVTCSIIGYNHYNGVTQLPAVVSKSTDEQVKSEVPPMSSNAEITDEKVQNTDDFRNSLKAESDIAKKTTEHSAEKSLQTPAAAKDEEHSAVIDSPSAPNADGAEDIISAESSGAADELPQNGIAAAFAATANDIAPETGDANSKKIVSDDGADMQSEIGSASSGGGARRSVKALAMSVAEYAEYIGVNVAEYLPNDFAYDGEDTLYVSFDGSATQLFSSSDGRIVSVTLTKDFENMGTYVKNSSLELLTETAVCDEYDDGCTVYGYGNNVGYIISGNLTKNEMKRLAESLSK